MTNFKQKRLIFIGVIFLISFIGLILVISSFKASMIFFYTPSEFIGNQVVLNKITNKTIRVGGLVKENSLKKIDALTIEFVIDDYQKQLVINHRGIVPDLFRDKQGVIAKGVFDQSQNKFFSEELLVKHDENYKPYELKNLEKNQQNDIK